jgi:hypothetical protein
MKRIKTDAGWFGEKTVVMHGTRHDPVPCIGEVVLLTGGVKAKVEQLGVIRSNPDGFRSDNIWTVQAQISFDS